MKSSRVSPSSRAPRVLAVAAHPDDIEFCMAGTLLQLQAAGWETHYLNVSSGNCGSLQYSAAKTRAVRLRESQAAAQILGARHHPSLSHDLEILYELKTLRRLAAVVRAVAPSIVLTHSPQDYMEDHTNTCRLAVTAAFARGMPNFRTIPSETPTAVEVTIYHAMPHGLRDGLRQRVRAGAFVDTTAVHARKRAALANHVSQKAWLDASQGMDSYLKEMDAMSLAVGRASRRFRHAEGWRRHLHLGFSAQEVDPLAEALGRRYLVDARYERALQTD